MWQGPKEMDPGSEETFSSFSPGTCSGAGKSEAPRVPSWDPERAPTAASSARDVIRFDRGKLLVKGENTQYDSAHELQTQGPDEKTT